MGHVLYLENKLAVCLFLTYCECRGCDKKCSRSNHIFNKLLCALYLSIFVERKPEMPKKSVCAITQRQNILYTRPWFCLFCQAEQHCNLVQICPPVQISPLQHHNHLLSSLFCLLSSLLCAHAAIGNRFIHFHAEVILFPASTAYFYFLFLISMFLFFFMFWYFYWVPAINSDYN